ncbi:M23 family metallopeptidase [Granulicoccus phenolivorans]|uniref:M23 family metallopeptidase n=1 Tax=Granulicoccus phenolivorans TaxID=266854 RepID=UPI0011AE4A3F|nr:M23 family metallopeptidase [Granulicoccus phenolivorans]
MSGNPFRRSQARRAAVATRVPTDPELSIKRLCGQSLAAVAISALGMAVAVSVGMTAAAESERLAGDAPATSQGNPDITRANPAPMAQQAERNLAAIQQAEVHQGDQAGSLDVFTRLSRDDTSRNVLRGELDKAVADQQAKRRTEQLTQSSDKAALESGTAVRDSRNKDLMNRTEATRRENERLAEEKRKTGEAQNQGGSNMPAAQPGDGAGLPSGGGAGGASVPMPQGRYSLGARWGAVGSWSRYHTGQDLPAPVGTPLRAAADGVVVTSNGGSWAGTHVVIRHADGSATLYAHMSGASVRPGQTVRGGDMIGAVGMTGRTFGPHLHFEHYPNAATVGNPYTTDDPAAWLARQGVRL